ncbi:hypothetical protein [Candidatus Nitrosocosmicus sp. R]|jgi:hypothetical protein
MSEANEFKENENEATTTGLDKYKKEHEVKEDEPDAIASAD